MKTIKVYISLPITGQENTVMGRCLKAKQQIEWLFATADNTRGYVPEIVTPLDADKIGTPKHDNSKPLSHWVGEDIKLLMDCDAIYLCEGYAESRGCQLEYKCASLYQRAILNQNGSISDNVSELEKLIKNREKHGL